MAIIPAKYGPADQALWGVPLMKKAGICQAAQTQPRSRPAQNGLNLRCISGRATPLQPNSPMGPRNNACASAGRARYQGAKGNGPARVPLMAAPAYTTAGIPKIRKSHQA